MIMGQSSNQSWLSTKAKELVERLLQELEVNNGIGSMSTTTYDSAWVAMVSKPSDRHSTWLSPKSFDFVLGAIGAGHTDGMYPTTVDRLLSEMASLLALYKLVENPDIQGYVPSVDVHQQMRILERSIEESLRSWNVGATNHVGFEVLVPRHLELLGRHGLYFDFEGRGLLRTLQKQKLARFNPEVLYSDRKMTLIHSLEAFDESVDFGRLQHHLNAGSMMGSPAATAAFLIHSPSWNDDAEGYLRSTVENGSGNGSGGVPSAYPTTNFELTWILSALLDGGFSIQDLGGSNCDSISSYLETELKANNGVIGFAPGILADADDSAKAVLTLELLQRPSDVDSLVANFEAETCFRTYAGERNGSLSANCNVLLALLYAPKPANYTRQVMKTADYLCKAWLRGAGDDKWNLAKQYTLMLLSHALVKLLSLWDNDKVGAIEHDMLQNICLTLAQVAIHSLNSQNEATWSHTTPSIEVTAYAILTLKRVASLPWLSAMSSKIIEAISTGEAFLESSSGASAEGDYVWVEKVTYRSANLCQAYRLSAIKASSYLEWGSRVKSLARMEPKKLQQMPVFYSKLPLFSKEPLWKLQAALIESQFYLHELEKRRTSIFPRKPNEEDKYLEYIPFTWIGPNNCAGSPLDYGVMLEMMVISMLNYQADEYMEEIIGEHFGDQLDTIRTLIERVCDATETSQPSSLKRAQNGSVPSNGEKRQKKYHDEQHNGTLHNGEPHKGDQTNGAQQNGEHHKVEQQSGGAHPATDKSPNASSTNGIVNVKLEDVERTLFNFVAYILSRPKVLASQLATQFALRRELKTFLLAHVTHCEDNQAFAPHFHQLPQQDSPPVTTTNGTNGANGTAATTTPRPFSRLPYHNWVRTISADHTSCPFSWTLFSILVTPDPPTHPCFVGATQKYLAADTCLHLATMCRQYNDYGSMVRDREEGNLNSGDFLEFHEGSGGGDVVGAAGARDGEEDVRGTDKADDRDVLVKKEILEIAEYERGCMQKSFGELVKRVDAGVARALQVFVDVTDLYGQIYVARDLRRI